MVLPVTRLARLKNLTSGQMSPSTVNFTRNTLERPCGTEGQEDWLRSRLFLFDRQIYCTMLYSELVQYRGVILSHLLMAVWYSITVHSFALCHVIHPYNVQKTL